MNKQQSGFTLIELIMVIVVLGALAATVLPRYVDLEGQAEQGATEGVAGALSAGSAINFADCKASGPTCIPFNFATAAADCADLGATLQGGIAAPHAITAKALVAADDAAGFTICTVTGAGGSSATFTALIP